MSQLPVDKFSLDSTVGEILGEPKGNPPSARLLELIAQVLDKFGSKWYVDQSILNDRIDITFKDKSTMKGCCLFLKEGIEYQLFAIIVSFTHHAEWHKPISIGGLTLAPFDRITPFNKIGRSAGGWRDYPQWYPLLQEQLAFFQEHPEEVDQIYQNLSLWPQITEIRGIIK